VADERPFSGVNGIDLKMDIERGSMKMKLVAQNFTEKSRET